MLRVDYVGMLVDFAELVELMQCAIWRVYGR